MMFFPKEILIDQEMIFIPRLSKRYKDRTISFENIKSVDSHVVEGTESFVKIRTGRKSVKVHSNQFENQDMFYDFVSYGAETWKTCNVIKADL